MVEEIGVGSIVLVCSGVDVLVGSTGVEVRGLSKCVGVATCPEVAVFITISVASGTTVVGVRMRSGLGPSQAVKQPDMIRMQVRYRMILDLFRGFMANSLIISVKDLALAVN